MSDHSQFAESGLTPVMARPMRPYRPDTPLVAVSETYVEDAEQAMSDVPELQDQLANTAAYLEALPAKVADFLLTYSADGDAKDPWQAGHNYAMREAARMVRERWHEIETPFRLHYRGDRPNGETTTCECEIGADHDL